MARKIFKQNLKVDKAISVVGMDQSEINKHYNLTYTTEHGEVLDYIENFNVFKTYKDAEDYAKDPFNEIPANYRIDTVENDYKDCEEA